MIIDDEAPARDLLREYLGGHPELVVVGEANNGVDAIRVIKEFRPEILFLDIQMPGMTGLEVLQQLDELPLIIFSTAYDQYAIQAFEVNAVDYLLKPYTKERFEKAVERLITRSMENLSKLSQLTESLLKSAQATEYPTKILISIRDRLVAINTVDIVRIEAEKDYSTLVTLEKNYLSSFGIGKIETKLDPSIFIRVHRSSIVNINFIGELIKYPSSYDIKMRNGDIVRVSRSYLENIRNLTF